MFLSNCINGNSSLKVIDREKMIYHPWFGLNSIYSVINNTIVSIYAMSRETGSDSKHKAYI